MKWTWLSMAPAVRILCSPEITSVATPTGIVTPSWVAGFPALPIAKMCPSRRATSALTMPVWSRMTTFVMTVSGIPSARTI